MDKLVRMIERKNSPVDKYDQKEGIFDIRTYQQNFQKIYTRTSIQKLSKQHYKRASYSEYSHNIRKDQYFYKNPKLNLKQEIRPHQARAITSNIAQLIRSKVQQTKHANKVEKSRDYLAETVCKHYKSSYSAYIMAKKKIFEKQSSIDNSSEFLHATFKSDQDNKLSYKQYKTQKQKDLLVLEPLILQNSQPDQKQIKQQNKKLNQDPSILSSPRKLKNIKYLQKIITKNVRGSARQKYQFNILTSRLDDQPKSATVKTGFLHNIKQQKNDSNLMINTTKSLKAKKKISEVQENPFQKILKIFIDQKHINQQEISLYPQISHIYPDKALSLDKSLFQSITSQSAIILHIQDGIASFKLSINQKSKTQIASITKIMTSFLILILAQKFQIDINKQKVLISDRASKMQGTSAKLAYSDTCTVYEALHALMLPSGNDAAIALGEWGGKNIRKYSSLLRRQRFPEQLNHNQKSLNFLTNYAVKRKSQLKLFIHHMNKVAKFLNLKRTYFVNTHGLMNEKAYSCSQDISLLTFYAMKNTTFRDIVGKKNFKCKLFNRTFSHSKTIQWENTNKLLAIQGFVGVKTGITPSAGPCLTSLFQISNNQYFIVVVLKTKCCQMRFKETIDLLKILLQNIQSSSQNQSYKKAIINIQKYAKLDIKQDQNEMQNNCIKQSTNDSDRQEDQINQNQTFLQ